MKSANGNIPHGDEAAGPTDLLLWVGAKLVVLAACVALVCLVVEYGAQAHSFLQGLGHAAARGLVLLVANFWAALCLCTLSWTVFLCAALTYAANAAHLRWKHVLGLFAVGLTAACVWGPSGSAAVTLAGEHPSAARVIAMAATTFFGLFAIGASIACVVRAALHRL